MIAESEPGPARRIGRNLLWVGASAALERLIFFATTVYLARVLGAASFGVLAAAQVTVLGLWLVVDLGVSSYGVREIARDRAGAAAVIDALYGARLAAATLGFVLFSAAVTIGMPLDRRAWTLLGSGLYLVANALAGDWVFRGLERFRALVPAAVVSSLAYLFGCLILVRGPDDVARAAFLGSGAAAVTALILWLQLYRQGIVLSPRFAPRAWLGHVRESAFFSAAAGVMAVYLLLPILLLERVATAVVLGLFSAPYRIAGSLGRAGLLVQSAFYPALAESWAAASGTFGPLHRRYQWLMGGLGLLTVGLGLGFAAPLVALLLGPEYAASTPVFRLLLVTMGVRLLRIAYDGILMATGGHRLKALLSLAGIATLALAWFSLPRVDPARAMATAVLVSEVLLLATFAAAARRRLTAAARE